MKIALTALVTAAACFAVMAATGLAAHSTRQAQIVVRVGDYVKIPGLDLACLYQARDPAKKERGQIMYCTRPSDTNPDDRAAALQISKYHFNVSATGATGWTTTIWRHP
jgi:hypothetical protein